MPFKVAASLSSTPVKAPKSIATSVTVLAIGPAVSWVFATGIIPLRLSNPTVGLKPTIPQKDAGLMIDPLVSVPIAAAQKLPATATAEPALEPDGLRSSA